MFSVEDFLTGERFQELCDVYCGTEFYFQYNPRIWQQTSKHCYIETLNSSYNNPRLVFCYARCLRILMSKLKFFMNPFVLISHNEDDEVNERYLQIANNPNLIRWYAQNLTFTHPKMELLPIGIANEMWPYGNLTLLQSATELSRNIPKSKDFYFYFNNTSNPSVRTSCRTALERSGFTFGTKLQYANYLYELSRHKFAFCPDGNGLDCHRTWECLYLGVIPIVSRNAFTEKLAEQFPCVLVDTWDNFSSEPYLSRYEELSTRLHETCDKLRFSQYRAKITAFDNIRPEYKLAEAPISLVYSYVGTLPNYSIYTIHQARLFFNGPIYFIVQDIASPYARLLQKRYGVCIVDYKECIDTDFLTLVEESDLCVHVTGHETANYRPLLFIRAFERFFLLRNLMRKRNLHNLFFVELDNTLYFNPQDFLPQFSQRDVCYMMDNTERCSSGVFFVKNSDVLNDMVQSFDAYIRECTVKNKLYMDEVAQMGEYLAYIYSTLPASVLLEWKQEFYDTKFSEKDVLGSTEHFEACKLHINEIFQKCPNLQTHSESLLKCLNILKHIQQVRNSLIFLHEMGALYYFYTHTPEKVLFLPTSWTSSVLPAAYSEQFELFQKTIFDSAPYGVFLYGMDVVHTFGEVKTGLKWKESLMDVTPYTYEMRDDAYGRRIPYIYNGSSWFRLNNLHISSKDMVPSLSKPYIVDPSVHYYLIHGVDTTREAFMISEFQNASIPAADVTWIRHPNKNESMPSDICINPQLQLGQISCTYKHYLALKDIIEHEYEYAIIMEDNIRFVGNVPDRIQRYIHELPYDWDILFDSDLCGLRYIEGPVTSEQIVYKKSNTYTNQCHGGSKGCNFMFINKRSAKKLYENFLPFFWVSDWHYTELLRRLALNSYWAEPPNVTYINRPSTAIC